MAKLIVKPVAVLGLLYSGPENAVREPVTARHSYGPPYLNYYAIYCHILGWGWGYGSLAMAALIISFSVIASF